MPNSDQKQFEELMIQVQLGDAAAAQKLVEQFEPEIRREVRIRLTDPRLRRVVDSIDICQSVLGNFFVRAVMGQFDIEHPNQLFQLLAAMARNKIVDRYRSEKVRRRAVDGYVPDHDFDTSGEPIAKNSDPDLTIESQEMLALVFNRLTNDEKTIATLRQQGVSWNDVAEQLGSNATALRKQLSRACDRIMGQLDEG